MREKQHRPRQDILAFIKQRSYLLFLPLITGIILYLHYVNALTFSFPDEYNSYVRAYFMDHGRTLYAGIFSHHNPLMVYFSYAIQHLISINSMYELVMVHRMAIAIFSIIMAVFLVLRFKWPAVGFVFLIEFVKYYMFGNLFLAESLVMYLLVYLFGLAWEKFHKRTLSNIDLILGGLSFFLIVFLREPLIPPAVVLSVYVFFDKNRIKLKAAIAIFLIFLSILLFSTVNFLEYYYHLVTLNFGGYIQGELETKGALGWGLLKIFLYPFYILVSGRPGDFRWILLLTDLLFISSLVVFIRQKQYLLVIALVFVLGLANIRYSEPGATFFNAFHMLPWFGMFVFSIILMIQKMKDLAIFPYMRVALITVCIVSILIALLPPYQVGSRPLSKHDEYSVNYSRFFIHGEVIKRLSNAGDTLFVDYWDTLVSWEAGLDSPYTYAMFFPVMSSIEKYTDPLKEMFVTDSPDFYYVDCNRKNPYMNEAWLKNYSRLRYDGKMTCLYIHNTKLPEITSDQWQSIAELGYTMDKVE